MNEPRSSFDIRAEIAGLDIQINRLRKEGERENSEEIRGLLDKKADLSAEYEQQRDLEWLAQTGDSMM